MGRPDEVGEEATAHAAALVRDQVDNGRARPDRLQNVVIGRQPYGDERLGRSASYRRGLQSSSMTMPATSTDRSGPLTSGTTCAPTSATRCAVSADTTTSVPTCRAAS